MEKNSMKKIFKVTALACLMASISPAMAVGPTANVQVKGTVKMGACTPSLDNGGVVDYGDISTDVLSSSTDYQLPIKYINFSIQCSSDTVLNWTITDNRARTEDMSTIILNVGQNNATATNNNNLLGLGLTSDKTKIGAWAGAFMYLQQVSNVQDSENIFSDDGISWSSAVGANGTFVDGVDQFRYVAIATKGSVIPEAFTSMTIPVKVTAAINKKTMTHIKDVTNIDGNITFSINYM